MTGKTIFTPFDQFALPDWAQKYPEVIERCKADLAFRCEVGKSTENKVAQRNLLISARLWSGKQ